MINIRASYAEAGMLRNLPTTARPVVDPNQVWVPEGYRVEVVAAGLSFPTGMTITDDGTIYINEGGSST